MPYYRFVSDQELLSIRSTRAILPSGHYRPYQPKEVVCLFEAEDLPALFDAYGRALGDMRELQVGDRLTILEVDTSSIGVQVDQSQNGWPESRVVFGEIALKLLSVVGEARVTAIRAGNVVFGPLQSLPGTPLSV
jgi:hypothetical protein